MSPLIPSAPRPERLNAQDVHIWRSSVAQLRDAELDLRKLLSIDERARADRFAFPEPRIQFTVGRGTLRCVLASYLSEPAESLRFVYGERGKPELAHASSLRFSVSHSDDLVIVAVTRDREVGVDVERRREDVEHEQIAEQSFCAQELAEIRKLPAAIRRREFFTYWTSKEALTKAVGDGLAIPLEAIRVQAGAGEPILDMTWSRAGGTEHWFAYQLDLGEHYAGVLAARSRDLHLSMLTLPGFERR